MKKIYPVTFLAGCLFLFSCGRNENDQREELTLPDSVSFLFSQLQKYDTTLRIPSKGFNYSVADSLISASYLKHGKGMSSEDLQRFVVLYKNSFNETRKQQARIEEWLGNADQINSRLPQAETRYRRAEEFYLEENDSSSLARINNLLGSVTFYKGEVENAARSHYKAFRIYESLGDTAGMMTSVEELGLTFQLVEKYKEAEALYRITLKYYLRVKDTTGIASANAAIGNVLHESGKNDESRFYAEEAMRLYKKTDDQVGIEYGYNNYAVGEMNAGNFEEAKKWLQKALALGDSINDFVQRPTELFNLGVCEMYTGNLNEAKALFIRSIQESDKNKELTEERLRAHKMLSEVYEKLNNPQLAFETFRSYSMLKDSLHNNENARMVEELKVSYQLQNQEEKLLKSEHESKSNERLVLLLSISFGLFFILVLFFIWFILYRGRSNREFLRMERELNLKELEQVRTELDFNHEQLAEYTLHMKEKSQQIVQLEEQISEGKLIQPHHKDGKEAEANPDDLPKSESIFGIKILTDEDWSRFKRYFDKVFPGKIQQLREIYPEITSAEQRIFMLIRLNTESREIADMLAISPESVRKTKYRLKKKLKLGEEVSLDEFIRQF